MKKCNEIERKLTAYLEGFTSGEEKDLIEGHLRDCSRCTRALEELKRTKELIGGLDEVEPPPWLTAKIMSRINEESEAKEGFFRKLFFPLHIKIPAEALAAVFVVVLSVLVYRSTMPDIKSIEHPLPEAQVSAQKPVDAGQGTVRSSVAKKVPVQSTRHDLEEKAADGREIAAAGRPNEQVQPSPQKALVVQNNGEKFARAKKESGFVERQETGVAKPSVPEVRMKDASSVPKGESYLASKTKADGNVVAGTVMKEEKSKAPVMRSAQSVESRQPRNWIIVLTDRPSETAREAKAILLSLGSKAVEENKRDNATVITGEIKVNTINELMDRLKKIGTIKKEHTLIDTSTDPVRVEIIIFGTGGDQNKPPE